MKKIKTTATPKVSSTALQVRVALGGAESEAHARKMISAVSNARSSSASHPNTLACGAPIRFRANCFRFFLPRTG